MIPELNGVQTLRTIQQTLASREAAPVAPLPTREAKAAPVAGFGDALNRLTNMQAESDHAIEQPLAGEEVELHQGMLSGEKTDIAVRGALQLRNKLVQAYQEIMRMQV